MSEGTDFDQALAQLQLPALRQFCVVLTALGALALGLPISRAWWAPMPLASMMDPAPSLDAVFNGLLVGQGLALAASLWVQGAWRRRTRGLPLAAAIRRTWRLRYLLAALICVLGGLAFYTAHLAGLLSVAPRIWWLGLLPLLALLWMLWNWPDEARLRKIFSRS